MRFFRNIHIRNSFFRQIDNQDCGIACLISVLRYFKTPVDYSSISALAEAKEWGLSMLGLKHLAQQSGYAAQGYQISLDHLQTIKTPVILHTVNQQGLNHFIVFYNYSNKRKTYLVGDPAEGIEEKSLFDLDDVWKSKAGLILTPVAPFTRTDYPGKWQWLFSLLNHEKFLLLIITFLGVLSAFMGLGLAVYLQTLTDKILPAGDLPYLITGLALLIILFIVRSFVGNYRQRIVISMVRDLNTKLVGEFSRHLANLPADFLRSKTAGDMVVRFNDTQSIQVAFSTVVTLILVDMVMLLAVTGYLFVYSVPVAMAIVVFTGLTISITVYNSAMLKRLQQKLTRDYSHANNILISTVDDLKRSAGLSADLSSDSAGFVDFIRSSEKFSTRVRQLSLRFDLIGSLFFAAILVYTSFLVMDSHYSKGQFLAIVTLISGVFPVVQRVCTTGMILMDGAVALERVYAMVVASRRNGPG